MCYHLSCILTLRKLHVCLAQALIAHSSSVGLAATAGRNQLWPLPCNMQSVDTSLALIQFVLLALCWYICSWCPNPGLMLLLWQGACPPSAPPFCHTWPQCPPGMRLHCLSSLAGMNSGVQEDMSKQLSERFIGLGKTLQGGHLIIDDLYK
jgi:hypothetical protein